MITWGPGYTQDQLDDAQAKWDLKFPPDLVSLYLEHRPNLPEPGTIDWVTTDDKFIRERLDWPLEGIWFDVQNNAIWWAEWGEKPTKPDQQYEVLKAVFAKAPDLVPIYSHRYIPNEPHEAGNPVFSVYQTDVIYYGADIMDYLEREVGGWGAKPWPDEIKHIPFWTLVVERNEPDGRRFNPNRYSLPGEEDC